MCITGPLSVNEEIIATTAGILSVYFTYIHNKRFLGKEQIIIVSRVINLGNSFSNTSTDLELSLILLEVNG